MADCSNDIAIEMGKVTAKILDAARRQDYHAKEASLNAQSVLRETRKLNDLRHRLNNLKKTEPDNGSS